MLSEKITSVQDFTGGRGLASNLLSSEYRTGQSDMIAEFYSPCLKQAIIYDRAVGYFRSTVLLLVSEELLLFAQNGGHIRILCSPYLSEDDIKAMQEGYASREVMTSALNQEIDSLLLQKDLEDKNTALATLIALNIIDIKIAFRPESLGMYHEKLGIFKDNAGNAVSFKGSVNETWNGWHSNGNYESIEVFCSWQPSDADRVQRHADFFEELWQGRAPGVEVLDFPTAARAKLCQIAKRDLNEVVLTRVSSKPKISSNARSAFPHQTEAIKNWKANNCRGIFQHATGSGKTFTAILAIKDHLETNGVALVLVPSKLLLRQWAQELKDELPDAAILKAGDGNDGWKRKSALQNFTASEAGTKSRIVLATMQTASSPLFIQKIVAGNHLLLVADEVHQSGSPENSKVYSINAGKRLGLSATPVRYGDPEGTQKMLMYFGGVVEPIFTLQDAINAGRLVPYEYYPHPINLNAEEADKWRDLSNQIKREMAKSPEDDKGRRKLSERAKMLLIQRARIAKKASAKTTLAEDILAEHYKDGQKWLVYCEDKDQLSDILIRLRHRGLHVNEYHTSMAADMDSTLAWFRRHGGILVSIRCLDEGVDIPDISHALILASSQNPRQFIQRRGRVLRKAPDKLKAILHDAIVVPVDLEKEADQLALVKSEFCRSIEFANGAINRMAAANLQKIAIDLGLETDIAMNGTEEEEEDYEPR